MKKKLFIVLGILAICTNVFAQADKIPDWMGNSIILMTKEYTGKTETINSLFSNPTETTTVKIWFQSVGLSASDGQLDPPLEGSPCNPEILCCVRA